MAEGKRGRVSPNGENDSPNGENVQMGSGLGADDQARRAIGEKIRLARERCELTQAQAAERLGVSRSTLAGWEHGKGALWATPDEEMLQRMGECYGCRLSELVARNQYPGAPLDPERRREYMVRRNACIQGVDPDEAWENVSGRREARG